MSVDGSPGSQMLFLTARPQWEMKLANGANTGLAQHLQCSPRRARHRQDSPVSHQGWSGACF